MGVYLVAVVVGIPCLLFLIYSYTPWGKEWMRQHNLL